MTAEDRVEAIAELGFTPRQARFLVFVMRHSGVCLPRQFSTFADIVHGEKTRAFFAKLVDRQYATAYACRHNRARLYHLHHFSLYRAIDEPNSAYRRALPAGRVAERLMMLDTVLTNPALDWLTSAAEKVAYSTQPPRAVPADALPRAGPSGTPSLDNAFPDRLPIGVDADGRPVFMYLVLPGVRDDLRALLRRHRSLLESLHSWTLRLVFPRTIGDAYAAYQAVVGEEYDTPLHPRTIEELTWYFEQLRATRDPNSRLGRGPVPASAQRVRPSSVPGALSALAEGRFGCSSTSRRRRSARRWRRVRIVSNRSFCPTDTAISRRWSTRLERRLLASPATGRQTMFAPLSRPNV